jgi:hypothetical protein
MSLLVEVSTPEEGSLDCVVAAEKPPFDTEHQKKECSNPRPDFT